MIQNTLNTDVNMALACRLINRHLCHISQHRNILCMTPLICITLVFYVFSTAPAVLPIVRALLRSSQKYHKNTFVLIFVFHSP